MHRARKQLKRDDGMHPDSESTPSTYCRYVLYIIHYIYDMMLLCTHQLVVFQKAFHDVTSNEEGLPHVRH